MQLGPAVGAVFASTGEEQEAAVRQVHENLALIDPELEGDANAEEMRRVCKVACWCIQRDVDTRPTMGEVVQVLEGLTNFEMPPVPQYLEVLVGRTVHETTYHTVEQLEAPAGRPVHETVYHSTEQFFRS